MNCKKQLLILCLGFLVMMLYGEISNFCKQYSKNKELARKILEDMKSEPISTRPNFIVLNIAQPFQGSSGAYKIPDKKFSNSW